MNCPECTEIRDDGDPGVVMAATLYLMSCYAVKPCPRLASMIRCHLCALNQHESLPATLRATCRQLTVRWDGLSTAGERPASVFSRFAILSTRTH